MTPVHYLLVDDLPENLLSLEALLRREGLVLLKARSGDEALELLLTHDVALALVDVQMPGLNGFELAELMRGNERTRQVPIIFVFFFALSFLFSFGTPIESYRPAATTTPLLSLLPLYLLSIRSGFVDTSVRLQ